MFFDKKIKDLPEDYFKEFVEYDIKDEIVRWFVEKIIWEKKVEFIADYKSIKWEIYKIYRTKKWFFWFYFKINSDKKISLKKKINNNTLSSLREQIDKRTFLVKLISFILGTFSIDSYKYKWNFKTNFWYIFEIYESKSSYKAVLSEKSKDYEKGYTVKRLSKSSLFVSLKNYLATWKTILIIDWKAFVKDIKDIKYEFIENYINKKWYKFKIYKWENGIYFSSWVVDTKIEILKKKLDLVDKSQWKLSLFFKIFSIFDIFYDIRWISSFGKLDTSNLEFIETYKTKNGLSIDIYKSWDNYICKAMSSRDLVKLKKRLDRIHKSPLFILSMIFILLLWSFWLYIFDSYMKDYANSFIEKDIDYKLKGQLEWYAFFDDYKLKDGKIYTKKKIDITGIIIDEKVLYSTWTKSWDWKYFLKWEVSIDINWLSKDLLSIDKELISKWNFSKGFSGNINSSIYAWTHLSNNWSMKSLSWISIDLIWNIEKNISMIWSYSYTWSFHSKSDLYMDWKKMPWSVTFSWSIFDEKLSYHDYSMLRMKNKIFSNPMATKKIIDKMVSVYLKEDISTPQKEFKLEENSDEKIDDEEYEISIVWDKIIVKKNWEVHIIDLKEKWYKPWASKNMSKEEIDSLVKEMFWNMDWWKTKVKSDSIKTTLENHNKSSKKKYADMYMDIDNTVNYLFENIRYSKSEDELKSWLEDMKKKLNNLNTNTSLFDSLILSLEDKKLLDSYISKIDDIYKKNFKKDIKLWVQDNIVKESFWVELNSGEFDKFIKSGTKLPANYSKDYYTIKSAQKSMTIKVFKWDEILAKDNLYLWKVRIWFKPVKEISKRISVLIDIDDTGKLFVKVIDLFDKTNKVSVYIDSSIDYLIDTSWKDSISKDIKLIKFYTKKINDILKK